MSHSSSPNGSSRAHHSADGASAPSVQRSTDSDGAGKQPPYTPPSPLRASSGQSSIDPLLKSRLAVLCILFFVTGALGLPLLWFSPRFSWLERFFWAVVVTVYTVLLIALVALVLRWSYQRII